jgi:elongation factor P--beta-lysine ligase
LDLVAMDERLRRRDALEETYLAAEAARPPSTGAAVALDRATATGRLRSRAALEETYLAAEAARPPSTGAAVALDLALALLQEEVTAATVADTEEVAESARGAASRSA